MDRSNLWAPWRIDYLRSLSPEHGVVGDFLAAAWAAPEDDPKNLVVHRGEAGLVLLNRYPYTNGHLLVAPGEAAADLTDLSPEVRAELMELIVLGERLLRAAFNPQGINVGFNIGRAAGAGLAGHLHAHLVPRWSGDTNFMDVVGGVRVIPQALETVYEELCAAHRALLDDSKGGAS